ncbi:hypothetical protein [Brevibacillus migulae]|uniref:hypothetical protein n=1 Tax=Brevibacillus migulae TaxID=1644114 RepID=UPI00106EE507|nr:hypothetical protein [Brevibacillus migulae]
MVSAAVLPITQRESASLEHVIRTDRGIVQRAEDVGMEVASTFSDMNDSTLVAIYEKQRASYRSAAPFFYTPSRVTANQSKPAEAWETFYQWNLSLYHAAGTYTKSIAEALDQNAEVLSDEDVIHLQEQLHTWLQGQHQQLAEGLLDAPPGIADKIMDAARIELGIYGYFMWRDVRQSVHAHNQAVPVAWDIYGQWNEQLAKQSEDYLKQVKGHVDQLTGKITDEQMVQMNKQLQEWTLGQHNQLQEKLSAKPDGVASKILETADLQLKNLRERLWNEVLQAISKHNLSVPPLPQPSTGSAGSVFHPQVRNERYEIGFGPNRAILALRNTPSVKKEDTLFYVVDAAGRRKAVTLTFADSRLQKEFVERFSQSSLRGKEVSLDAFEQFLNRMKKSIRHISEAELQRLKSKIYKEQETKKLDAAVAEFLAVLKRMKQAY